VATAAKGKTASKAASNGVPTTQAEREAAAQFDGDDSPLGPPAPPVPPVEEIRVDGTVQLSMFDLGGKQAQSSSLRLTGGKVKLVDGAAYRKGDVIAGTFTAVVNEVGQKDTHDPQTGIVVSAEQKHSARITDLRVRGAK
jgi:hypothetical protein